MAIWRISASEEDTQSNTYMPLICSVIDEFEVEFPEGYETLFNRTIKTYNDRFRSIGDLDFRDFEGFKRFLKGRVQRQIGNSSKKKFDVFCDSEYHMFPHLQTKIMEGHVLEAFFGLFMRELRSKLSGRVCTLRLRHVAHRPAAHDSAHSASAHRPASHDASRSHDSSAHSASAHRPSAHSQDRRPAAHVGPTWHYKDDDGIFVPYSDKANAIIMEEVMTGLNEIDLGHVTINVEKGIQINKFNHKVTPIGLMGGKTKKRRMKRKRTRHR